MNKFGQVLVLLGLVFCSSLASAQNEPENCCFTCECYYCGSVAECDANPFFPFTDCESGGSGNCDLFGTPCTGWTDNNLTLNPTGTTGNACVPIDGGLVVLISGGLGMAFASLRRRERLSLLQL